MSLKTTLKICGILLLIKRTFYDVLTRFLTQLLIGPLIGDVNCDKQTTSLMNETDKNKFIP